MAGPILFSIAGLGREQKRLQPRYRGAPESMVLGSNVVEMLSPFHPIGSITSSAEAVSIETGVAAREFSSNYQATTPATLPRSTLMPMASMPQPGDRHPGFVAQPGECSALINSKQLQATHCREEPSGSSAGDGGDRVDLRD